MVFNAYRPPQSDYKKACTLIHKSIAAAGLKENSEIFLIGDFNINRSKVHHRQGNCYLRGALNGLAPKINDTTRCCNREGKITETCIDNIFTNWLLIEEAKVLDLNISDHLAVYVRRKKKRAVFKKVNFTGRSYRNFVKDRQQSIGAILRCAL